MAPTKASKRGAARPDGLDTKNIITTDSKRTRAAHGVAVAVPTRLVDEGKPAATKKRAAPKSTAKKVTKKTGRAGAKAAPKAKPKPKKAAAAPKPRAQRERSAPRDAADVPATGAVAANTTVPRRASPLRSKAKGVAKSPAKKRSPAKSPAKK